MSRIEFNNREKERKKRCPMIAYLFRKIMTILKQTAEQMWYFYCKIYDIHLADYKIKY